MGEKLEAWGIVELMGHQRTAGRITEQTVGGANLLRVDIPDGENFRTAYYGASAIYALHITDEKAARAAAGVMGSRPPFAYELDSHIRKLSAPSRQPYAEAGPDQEVDDDLGQDAFPV
jgi:hypothetical protein